MGNSEEMDIDQHNSGKHPLFPDDSELYKPVAEAAAVYAHTGYVSSRRGVLPSDGHLLIAYDNNPYAGDKERRGRELDALKQVMFSDEGAKVVAEAAYPIDGERAGYTVAVVWRIDKEEAADNIEEHWMGIIRAEQTKAFEKEKQQA